MRDVPLTLNSKMVSFHFHLKEKLEKMNHSYVYRRRQWQLNPVLFPGKSYGQRSLVGCNPWGLQESDMTERLHFHFSLSCIGEGNGNPLQCCCLESPRDRGAWWAAISGAAQSWTRLKRLSSNSSSLIRWLRWYGVYLQCGRPGFNPWVGKISWRRKWQPTPVFFFFF